MFTEFYHLQEVPFGVTPDPRYLYLSRGHREAMAALLYGLEAGRGFVSLTGEPGMGKTTLLFQLLQRWKETVNTAFLFQTQCDSRELIRYLLHDLGLNSEGDNIVRMHSELNQFLFREALAGRRTVVFIDEAQNLSETVLETVRLLSDFEATDQKLLHIVLAGQPELADRLSQPGMTQLRQRLAVQARLSPLSPAEVVPYIDHRLSVAGYSGPGLFTPGALSMIAEASNGIPRVINNICFHALSLGYAKSSEKITSEIVREVEDDLELCARPAKLKSTGVAQSAPLPREAAAPMDTFSFLAAGRMLSWRGVKTTAVSVLVAGLLTYFGLRAAARTGQAPPVVHAERTVQLAAQPRTQKPVVSAVPVVAPGREQVQPSQAPAPAANSSRSFTYVVQQEDTLHDLCTWATGRCDAGALAQIRSLNPELRDSDHLEIGQKIRLPLLAEDPGKAISTQDLSVRGKSSGAGLQ